MIRLPPRALRPRGRAFASTKAHPFLIVDEYSAFKSLLLDRPTPVPLEGLCVMHIRNLRQLEEKRRSKVKGIDDSVRLSSILKKRLQKAKSDSQADLSGVELPATVVSEVVKEISSLKQIDAQAISRTMRRFAGRSFSHTDVFSRSREKSAMVEVFRLILTMLDRQSLPVAMEVLNTVLVSGLDGVYLSEKEKKRLVVGVLEQALALHQPNSFHQKSDTVEGVYDLKSIEPFVSLYKLYVETAASIPNVKIGSDLEAYDLVVRLAARSGPISVSGPLLQDMINADIVPSVDTVDAFVGSLMRYLRAWQSLGEGQSVDFLDRVKQDVVVYRSLLISEQVTPAVVQLLLLLSRTLDEVYSVLEVASNSSHCDEIFRTCQIPVIDAVVNAARQSLSDGGSSDYIDRAGPPMSVAMAHMFGVLARFKSVGIAPETYDRCLLQCAIHGNSPGMYRSIALRKGLEQQHIDGIDHSSPPVKPMDEDIVCQVLDRLPVTDGMAKETKKSDYWWFSNDLVSGSSSVDRSVLSYLRSLFDMPARPYRHFIGALGRFGMSSELSAEWEMLQSSVPTLESVSQDLILEFIQAFRTANATPQALQVLEAALKMRSGYAMSILKHVFRYSIIPVDQALLFVSRFLIQNRDRHDQYSQVEIEQVFEEVGALRSGSEAKAASMIAKAVAEAVIQVRGGQDIDDSLRHLDHVLTRHML
uniref:ATPase expression protein 1 n=1 Tax=Blastobotrys adeninivorans TaxID=409370 RepID=A0A060SWT2_BLAAD